jgi:predicted nuclease of predicted toxin-antitoxin system
VKVLLDEMLPVGVADLLPGHDVTTVKAGGYAGLKNGELIRRAIIDGYDVLVTADRNMPAQQNIRASGIAVVLVAGNRLADIEPKAAAIRDAIATARTGTLTRVGRPG